MAKEVFSWLPDIGAQQSVKPGVHSTKFGDGYEVRTPLGINNKPKKWSVRFSKGALEAQAILAFLESHGGSKSFTWTDPMGVIGNYVCREWSSSQKMTGIYEVTGSFEQVFEA